MFFHKDAARLRYYFLLSIFLSFLFCSARVIADDEASFSSATFVPPKGWHLVDERTLPSGKRLPPSVRVMVIGDGSFPPSINLAVEPFSGTTEDYLKIVKRLNQAEEFQWRDLGKINSPAGQLHISQLDTPSEWGALRMMHAIVVRDGNAYILTAASLKDEFANYQKDFFRSFSSFSIKEILKQDSETGVNEQISFKELQKTQIYVIQVSMSFQAMFSNKFLKHSTHRGVAS